MFCWSGFPVSQASSGFVTDKTVQAAAFSNFNTKRRSKNMQMIKSQLKAGGVRTMSCVKRTRACSFQLTLTVDVCLQSCMQKVLVWNMQQKSCCSIIDETQSCLVLTWVQVTLKSLLIELKSESRLVWVKFKSKSLIWNSKFKFVQALFMTLKSQFTSKLIINQMIQMIAEEGNLIIQIFYFRLTEI